MTLLSSTRLRAAALRDDDVRVGVLHSKNERDARGGFSLYVPETWAGRVNTSADRGPARRPRARSATSCGAWLREARARGLLVLAPTSRDRTWSIMGGEDVDADSLRAMVESVADRYAVDRRRVLLTGMSDGATYALPLRPGRGDAPLHHLAPMCGVLHPYLLAGASREHGTGRSI